MSSEYQDKRLLGVLEGIDATLEQIAHRLHDLAHLRLLANDIRPEPDSETECEPCIDMDHQKNYK